MKIRLLLALSGFAISFVLTTFAQEKDKVDLPISQQRDLLGSPNALEVFGDLSGKLDDAYNNKDAEAAAALFTEDAVLVTPDGMVFGRQAIEKRYADTFQRWPITGFLSRRERLQLNVIDNAVWSVGEWTGTLQGQTGPVLAWGYWSTIYVREGDAWKMRMLSLFDHRPLSPRSQ
jgi:ketosteroid isomerase-like protein